MNTYKCSEYSCKVLAEIALYFELQKNNKYVAVYRDILFLENCLFSIAQNKKHFHPKFLPYL
jgi:hypothetical protein